MAKPLNKFFLLVSLILLTSCTLNASPGNPSLEILGADISFVDQDEFWGTKFYENGAGFLWDSLAEGTGGEIQNWDNFTAFLKKGIQGVRDTDPQIKIMIHHQSADSAS